MSKVSVPARVVVSGNDDSVLAAKDSFVNQGYAVFPLPEMRHHLLYNIRPEVARSCLISMLSVYPAPIVFTGGNSYDHELILENAGTMLNTDLLPSSKSNGYADQRSKNVGLTFSPKNSNFSPVRIILTGATESVLAAREYLISQDCAIWTVPSAGSSLRHGVRPEVCKHAISSMMRCYPLPVVFTGGNTDDHKWLMARRGIVLNITESCGMEVKASFEENAPFWCSYSNEPFVLKLQRALSICQMITRDFQSHQVPFEQSAYATC